MDWYSVILGAGETLYIELRVEEGADISSVDLGIYGEGNGYNNDYRAGSVEINGDRLFIAYEAAVEDFYYVAVEAPTQTRYSLSVRYN